MLDEGDKLFEDGVAGFRDQVSTLCNKRNNNFYQLPFRFLVLFSNDFCV